jgi:hypothetical protein
VPWRYGTVAVWNVATGRLLWRVRNKDGWVNDVAFSPDGAMLAAAQETNRVTLYDPQTGQALRAVHPEGLTGYVSVAFSPGGLLATGVWSGIVQLWDPSSGREVGKPTPVAPAPVSSITFNPSGSTFATTTARARSGRPRWAPGSGEHAPWPAGTSRRRSGASTSGALPTGQPARVSPASAAHKSPVSDADDPPRNGRTGGPEAKEARRCSHREGSSLLPVWPS